VYWFPPFRVADFTAGMLLAELLHRDVTAKSKVHPPTPHTYARAHARARAHSR
jgi:hypothetical protein